MHPVFGAISLRRQQVLTGLHNRKPQLASLTACFITSRNVLRPALLVARHAASANSREAASASDGFASLRG